MLKDDEFSNNILVFLVNTRHKDSFLVSMISEKGCRRFPACCLFMLQLMTLLSVKQNSVNLICCLPKLAST